MHKHVNTETGNANYGQKWMKISKKYSLQNVKLSWTVYYNPQTTKVH